MLHGFSHPAIRVLICAILFTSVSNLWAADADGSKKDSGIKTELGFVFATTLETQVSIMQTLSTREKTVQFSSGVKVSPVSVNACIDLVITPLPFFQLTAGAGAGTGWAIPIAEGMSINDATDGFTDASLSGAVWTVKGGAVFQADLAVLWPGDWHHIVFRTTQEINYRAFTGAADEESWHYEGDTGEERNGLNWYANYFFGWQLPLRVNMLGLFVEQKTYLYKWEGGEAWGDDLSRWVFGPMVSISVSKRVSACFVVQARTQRNYTVETENEKFYQNRELVKDNPLRYEFYRTAIIVNCIL